LFILPWALPSIPTILSVRFMLNPEWGVINTQIFQLTGLDGPNWLNDTTLAMTFAMLMHIWKSLPFWTLILLAGRMSIPAEQYEAASVDGASSWQKFRFITWPSMQTLYLTSTILSMIWTLGDFNSVYLLTGGGPADLTHVLATLGIRYLRLDQVDLAMASIVVALPLVLPLVFFMMKRLSKCRPIHETLDLAQHPDRGQTAADRYPLVFVDDDPGLSLGLVFYFAKGLGHLGSALAQRTHPAKL
jgi:multiple sugar transport system permease protein